MDNLRANQTSQNKFKKSHENSSNFQTSFKWENADSISDSSPDSSGNQIVSKENSKNLKHPSGIFVQQNSDSEIKKMDSDEENLGHTERKTDSKRNGSLNSENRNEMFKFSGNTEKSKNAQNESVITSHSGDYYETYHHESVDENWRKEKKEDIKEDAAASGIDNRSENQAWKPVNKSLNSSKDSKTCQKSVELERKDLKRKFDHVLEKNISVDKKRTKLSNLIEDLSKNRMDTSKAEDKNYLKGKKSFTKSDVYSFEKEENVDKDSEFSYETFDKTVLYKRKSNASFQKNKTIGSQSTCIDKRNSSDSSHDEKFDKVAVKHDTGPVNKEELTMSVISNYFDPDYSKQQQEVKDVKLPESEETNKKEQQEKVKDKNLPESEANYFSHFDDIEMPKFQGSVGRNLSQKTNKYSYNVCDNTMPSLCNPSICKLSRSKLNNFVKNCASQKTVYNSKCNEFTSTGIVNSKVSNINKTKIVDNIQNGKISMDTKYKGSFINDTDIDGKTPKEHNSMLNSDNKFRGKGNLACHGSGLQKNPPVSVGLKSNGNITKVSQTRKFNHLNGREKYLGFDWSRPVVNGNRVIDRRLEAVRKVSLWIGDCIKSSAENLDVPEDMSFDKLVPISALQKNGKCASLSDSFNSTSVKNKCADTDSVKCAMSNADMKSEHATDVEIKDEIERLNCPEAKILSASVQNVFSINSLVNSRNGTLNKEKCAIKRNIDVHENLQKVGRRKHSCGSGRSNSEEQDTVLLDSFDPVKEHDFKEECGSKEQSSPNFHQVWFMDKCNPDAYNSKPLSIKTGPLHSVGKISRTENTILAKDRTSQTKQVEGSRVGERSVLKMKETQHVLRNKKMTNFGDKCFDLSVKSVNEQSFYDKPCDRGKLGVNDANKSYGAEVWGQGNAVYNVDSGVRNTNDLTLYSKIASKTNTSVLISENGSENLCRSVEVNVVKIGCSVENSAETSNNGGNYIKSASNNRSCVIVDPNSNKNSSERLDIGNKDELRKSVRNKSDNLQCSHTSEKVILTYPDCKIVNRKRGTENLPLDLITDSENSENAKYCLTKFLSAGKKNMNESDTLFDTNTGASLSDLGNLQGSSNFVEINKGMPELIESHFLNNDGLKSENHSETGSSHTNQTARGSETSAQIPVVNSVLTDDFSCQDWSADDLEGLDLNTVDEISPATITGCPVSLTDTIFSYSKSTGTLGGSQVILNSKPDSDSGIPVSPSSDPFSVYQFSSASNLVSESSSPVSEDKKTIVSNFNFGVNQLFTDYPRKSSYVSNQNGNQFSNFIENDGNQFPLEEDLIAEKEDYQWNQTLKSFIMQNLDNEPKEENARKEPTEDVELLLEQKLAEQYLNRNIESLKRKNSVNL